MTANNYVVNNGYIVLPVTTNPKTIYQNAVKAINTQLPGWIPRESQLDNILLEQFAAMTAESANVAAAVPESIFAYFGALIGITPNPGSPATVLTTWTMVDDRGYTIPRGATVGYQVLGNQLYTFTVQTAFTIPPNTTQAHNINVVSTNVGSAYNGLKPTTYPTLVLVSPSLTYIRTIRPSTETAGGQTPEQTGPYLSRLSQELQLLSPRPILTPDFAILARNVAGVYRAAAYNNLNPFANNLTAEDATFRGGLGSWVAVSGCVTPTPITNVPGPSGGTALRIQASGSGNAVIETGSYPLPQKNHCLALVSMDRVDASHDRTIILSVLCYDINTTLLGTFITPAVPTRETTATTTTNGPMTFVSVAFTTPTHTTHAKLRLSVVSPGATEYQYVRFPGLFQMVTFKNLVPDSTLNQVVAAKSWVHNTALGLKIFASHQYAFVYTGTGSASGTKVASSEAFHLPFGSYYVSGYIDATHVTSGLPEILVGSPNGSTPPSLTISQSSGTKGTVTGTLTIATATGQTVSFRFDTNNCTVASGQPLVMASPLVLHGSTAAPYVPGPAWGPATAIYGNERMVAVFPVDHTGLALNTVVMAEVAAYLESLREVNFVVNVAPPDYITIDVRWSGFTTTGNPTTVQTAANTALRSYLSPANWGGGTQTPPVWNAAQNLVRYLEVATILGETPGLTLTTLQIGYHNGSLGTADLTLYGFGPLPRLATLNGNVTTTA